MPMFTLLAILYFFSSENKNLFKNLNTLNYHLYKSLFRLTWENPGS